MAHLAAETTCSFKQPSISPLTAAASVTSWISITRPRFPAPLPFREIPFGATGHRPQRMNHPLWEHTSHQHASTACTIRDAFPTEGAPGEPWGRNHTRSTGPLAQSDAVPRPPSTGPSLDRGSSPQRVHPALAGQPPPSPLLRRRCPADHAASPDADSDPRLLQAAEADGSSRSGERV